MTYSFIEILLSERDGKVINWSLLCFPIHKGKMTHWSPNHTRVMKKQIEGTHRGSLVSLITGRYD